MLNEMAPPTRMNPPAGLLLLSWEGLFPVSFPALLHWADADSEPMRSIMIIRIDFFMNECVLVLMYVFQIMFSLYKSLISS